MAEVVRGLYAVIPPDVQHGHSLLLQHTRDEEAAMTVRRVFFAAHDCCAVDSSFVGQTLQAAQEEWRLRRAIIQNVAFFVIEFVAWRTPPKLIAQVDIANARTLDRIFELWAVEVGHIARVGSRAHIYQRLNAVPLEQRDEGVLRLIGVADRVDRDRGVRLCLRIGAHGFLPSIRPLDQ